MTAEIRRIEFLLARDGLDAAREWVRRTLHIYLEALHNPRSHAALPEYRPLFEAAVREYEEWLASVEKQR